MSEPKNIVGMSVCWHCGGPGNEIFMHRRLANVPDRAVISMEPCTTCQQLMQKAVMIYIVPDGTQARVEQEYQEHKIANAQRIPSQKRSFIPRINRIASVGVADHAIKRMINEPLQSQLLQGRWGVMGESDAKQIGLIGPDAPKPMFDTVEAVIAADKPKEPEEPKEAPDGPPHV